MLRSIGAVVAGVIVGAFVIFIVESVGHLIFPPPPGVDLKDAAALSAMMSVIPFGAKLGVVIAWMAGVLAGGVAALAIGRRWAPLAIVVATTLFAMAVVTMLTIPHPFWMQAAALAVTVLGAFGAIRIMRATFAPPTAPKLKSLV